MQTRLELEAREAELDAARDRSRRAFDRVDGHVDRLEGHVDGLEEKIQEQLAAAAAAESGVAPLPAGPIQARLGRDDLARQRPGRLALRHALGPDARGRRHRRPRRDPDPRRPGRAPSSSPRRRGGYGNYTCVDHGGGLSTCYAHQSSFAITSGSVSQGDVIGYVGCTGHCFGDHLHFEVRVNGAAVDPMGYL